MFSSISLPQKKKKKKILWFLYILDPGDHFTKRRLASSGQNFNTFYPTPQFSAAYVTWRCARRRTLLRLFLKHTFKPSEDVIQK